MNYFIEPVSILVLCRCLFIEENGKSSNCSEAYSLNVNTSVCDTLCKHSFHPQEKRYLVIS